MGQRCFVVDFNEYQCNIRLILTLKNHILLWHFYLEGADVLSLNDSYTLLAEFHSKVIQIPISASEDCFCQINIVDSDEMFHSVEFHFGIYCL